MKRIPKRLVNNPIQEALFEVRFEGAGIPPTEILPGIFFTHGAEKFGLTSIERLMPAIPKELIQKDERLRYLPQVRIKGNRLGIQIGDQIASIAYLSPYEGWEVFRKNIEEFLSILDQVREKVFKNFTRFSLKYVNLFEDFHDITCLDLDIKIGDKQVSKERIALGVEFLEGNRTIILTIDSTAMIQLEGKTKRGLLLAIDAIEHISFDSQNQSKILTLIKERLEDLHNVEKTWFFKLLKQETIDKLVPEYDNE